VTVVGIDRLSGVALLKAAQIVEDVVVVDVVACSTCGCNSPETRRLLALAAGIAMSGFFSRALMSPDGK
jgi:hypothetical protein